MCTPSNPLSTPPKTPTRDPAAPTPPPKPPHPNRSPTSRSRRRRRGAHDPNGKCSSITKPRTTPDESTTPPSSPKRRRRRRGRRSKAATEAPGTPHDSSTRRRRRRRRRRRGNPPCTEAQAQSQVEQSRPTPPRADAPPFNPKQEEQPDYAGEDDPCNRKTPIWLPSARVLVDTVTGLQFLFFAYPDGRLHPAQDVTHHHRGHHTRPSTMPAHGRTAL